MLNEFLTATLEAIKSKADAALAELCNPINRTEDAAEPRPYLDMFLDMSKVTAVWWNFGVIRKLSAMFYPHLGMDFTAPKGTALQATARSGVVIRVRRSKRKGWGNLITLRVTEGYFQGLYVTFCHCKDIADLKKGDMVEAGEVVAWVGNTGNSTAPHVHVMCSWLKPVFTGYKKRLEDCYIRGFIDPASVFDIRRAIREAAAKTPA